MQMVVLLPAGVATREVMVPLEVLHERLGLEVIWAGSHQGLVPGHDPPMSFHAQTALTEVSEAPAVLLLPGGFGSLEMASDPALVEHLRELVTPEVVCLAVSTGSLPLAATGLLNGHEVAGHWLSRRLLRRFGAIPVDDPLAVSDRLVTASGSVSAGEAAKIAADITSYAPPPPDRRGSFHLRQGP